MSEVERIYQYTAPNGEGVFVVNAKHYDALAAECERLQREVGNDAVAYRAAIERQNEIRAERDTALAELAAQASAWSEEMRELLAEMVDIHQRRGVVLTVHVEQIAAILAAAPTPGASDGKEEV